MTAKEASEYMISKNLYHSHIKFIPEGANHFIFDVTLSSGEQAIARFGSGRQSKMDSLFGGILCRHREESNINHIRNSGLPAPAVLFSSKEFMLVEKLPGLLWNEYMEQNNHALEACSNSLKQLGASIATLQQSTRGIAFGDADGHAVTGQYKNCFSDRMLDVLEYRLRDSKDVFSNDEKMNFIKFFRNRLKAISAKEQEPVLVMTDMHPMNFLVNYNGKPTGFFDLETCQYAHPALEMYGIRLFLFNYYNNLATAEKAFFNGFHKAGGKYDPSMPENRELETLLGLMRALEFTISYNGVKDGLRNSWSDRFKVLLLKGIETGAMDWQGAAGILREKTRQPLIAL